MIVDSACAFLFSVVLLCWLSVKDRKQILLAAWP